MDMPQLLKFSVQKSASDLHISSGLPPMLRIDGELHRLDSPALDAKTTSELLYDVMNDNQRKQFEQEQEADFSFEIPNLARFRVNIFNQNRGICGVFRTIPVEVLSFETLGLPKAMEDIANLPRGLVLVTGPTGSGKSTTLAAILDYINDRHYRHILTIEDPIEFVHPSKRCLVNQREVHRDTHSFSNALRAALREDPDIILVGEMRDLDTIRLALSAAETGHLVFATLHTNSAAKSINRIVDAFPGNEKSMIRTMLSESLEAVISQLLLKKEGGGRIAAHEIMICNSAIRNLIREDKAAQIYSALQTGQQAGMQTMDQDLHRLLKEGKINAKSARDVAIDKNKF